MANKFGRFSTNDPDTGIMAANTGTACTYRTMTENGWGSSIGAHCGKVSSGDNPDARFAVYAVSTGNPTNRMAYTSLEHITALMTSGADGDAFTANIAAVDDGYGPSNKGVMLKSGVRYAIAMVAIGGPLYYGMIRDNLIDETYENFYYRSSAGSIPPDPYGTTSQSLEGWVSLWVNYDPNEPPDAPYDLSPTGTIATTTPVFSAHFNDPNANRGDMLKQYQIQLRQVGTTSNKWDSTYSANNSEQDADEIERAYGGTALSPGVTYEWRARFSDQFGAWSSWCLWTSFTVSGGGTVTISGGTPSGRQEQITGLVFQARWNHVSALNMDRAQIRLLQSGSVIGTSGEITGFNVVSSPAPGTLFSINQSQSSIFNSIIWGQSYQYQVRGRATNGVWSAWSNARTFTINAQPNIPDKLSPSGLKASSSLPPLICTMTDPDDTYATGLRCYAQITGSYITDNWSFDTDAAGWTNATTDPGITATFARATDQFFSSPASGKITVTAFSGAVGARKFVQHDQKYPCVAGQSYQHQGQFRTSNTNLVPHLGIDWFTAGDVYISSVYSSEFVPPANTWYYHNLIATAPANAAYMRTMTYVDFKAAGATGAVWFDNFTVEPGVRYERAMALQAGSAVDWEYQTTITDLPDYGTYSWRAFGNDGTVNGQLSKSESFKYQLGPSVTITAPTASQVIATSTPVIDWTTTDQQKYQVDIYLSDGVTLIYTSGQVTTGTTDHLVPPGYLLNGFTCKVYVTVWNSLNIDGTSSPRSFSVTYPPVDFVIGVEISTVTLQFDTQPSAILLSWVETDYAPDEFEFYSIYRRRSDQDDSERILLRKITSPGQTTFLDAHPQSDVEYVYGISQTIVEGSENLEGATTDVAASIHLRNTVITSVDDPDDTRIVIKYWSDRGWDDVTDAVELLPWGASKPTTLFGSVYYKTLTITARFVSDLQGSIAEYETAVNKLLARRGIVCYRDPKGRRAFGVLKRTGHEDQAMGTLAEIEFEITETNYQEGVA